MVRSIRGAPLLFGHRGRAPCDVPAVEDVLLRVACLADAVPQLAEMDLNPLIALPDRGCRGRRADPHRALASPHGDRGSPPPLTDRSNDPACAGTLTVKGPTRHSQRDGFRLCWRRERGDDDGCTVRYRKTNTRRQHHDHRNALADLRSPGRPDRHPRLRGGFAFWGSNFATSTVHDQLAAQQIYFPAADSRRSPRCPRSMPPP